MREAAVLDAVTFGICPLLGAILGRQLRLRRVANIAPWGAFTQPPCERQARPAIGGRLLHFVCTAPNLLRPWGIADSDLKPSGKLLTQQAALHGG